jgi:hypothetical protein
MPGRSKREPFQQSACSWRLISTGRGINTLREKYESSVNMRARARARENAEIPIKKDEVELRPIDG